MLVCDVMRVTFILVHKERMEYESRFIRNKIHISPESSRITPLPKHVDNRTYSNRFRNEVIKNNIMRNC